MVNEDRSARWRKQRLGNLGFRAKQHLVLCPELPGPGAASGNGLDLARPPRSHCGNGHSSPSSPSCCEGHRCARVRHEALEGRRSHHNPHSYQATWIPFFLAPSPASHPIATQTCDMLLQTAWVPLARVRGPTCALWNVVTIEGGLMAPPWLQLLRSTEGRCVCGGCQSSGQRG